MNFVPARLSGALIAAAAAFLPGAAVARAWRTMRADAGRHRSVNAGWPEAAAAGALGLALAGPRRYGNVTVEDAWMGDGRARATALDIKRALLLYVTSCVVHAAVLAVAAVALAPR
jgi:adenosylcobinamide-phosphate synthase